MPGEAQNSHSRHLTARHFLYAAVACAGILSLPEVAFAWSDMSENIMMYVPKQSALVGLWAFAALLNIGSFIALIIRSKPAGNNSALHQTRSYGLAFFTALIIYLFLSATFVSIPVLPGSSAKPPNGVWHTAPMLPALISFFSCLILAGISFLFLHKNTPPR